MSNLRSVSRAEVEDMARINDKTLLLFEPLGDPQDAEKFTARQILDKLFSRTLDERTIDQVWEEDVFSVRKLN